MQGDEPEVPGSIHISVPDRVTVFAFEHSMQRVARKLAIVGLLADVFQGQCLAFGAHHGRTELKDLDKYQMSKAIVMAESTKYYSGYTSSLPFHRR